MNWVRVIWLFLFAMSLPIAISSPRTEIVFWHAMSGELGASLNQLVETYNHSQKKFTVKPVYKGGYTETLVNLVAAFRAHQQPAIAQIYDIGTATLLTPTGVIIPFYQVMASHNRTENWHMIPVIQGYYSDDQSRLLALPFNVSTPILYYNKTALKKAGLNPDQPPRTWRALYQFAKALSQSGQRCALTTTWPTWIHVENMTLWHRLPFATDHNGFDSVTPHLLFNQSNVEDHLTLLHQWQTQGYFQYGGREDNAMALFTSGKCAMSTMSSGGVTALKKQVDFDIGVGPLPYHDDINGAPQNTLLGGAALWTLTGHSEKVYAGVADFYRFLLQTSSQLTWQAHSGYIVITEPALRAAEKSGFYQEHPEIKVAINSLMHKPPSPGLRGIRLGHYTQCRIILDEALEQIFSGKKTAEQALNAAVEECNTQLSRFGENVKEVP